MEPTDKLSSCRDVSSLNAVDKLMEWIPRIGLQLRFEQLFDVCVYSLLKTHVPVMIYRPDFFHASKFIAGSDCVVVQCLPREAVDDNAQPTADTHGNI